MPPGTRDGGGASRARAACVSCGVVPGGVAVFCPRCGTATGAAAPAGGAGAARQTFSSLGMLRGDAAGPPAGLGGGAKGRCQRVTSANAAAHAAAPPRTLPPLLAAELGDELRAARAVVFDSERRARDVLQSHAQRHRGAIAADLRERTDRRRILNEERRVRCEAFDAHLQGWAALVAPLRGAGASAAAAMPARRWQPPAHAPTPPDSRASSPRSRASSPATLATASASSVSWPRQELHAPRSEGHERAADAEEELVDPLAGARGQILLDALALAERRQQRTQDDAAPADPLEQESSFTEGLKACVGEPDAKPPAPRGKGGGKRAGQGPRGRGHQHHVASTRSKTFTEGTVGNGRRKAPRGSPVEEPLKDPKPLPKRFRERTGLSSRARTSSTRSVLLADVPAGTAEESPPPAVTSPPPPEDQPRTPESACPSPPSSCENNEAAAAAAEEPPPPQERRASGTAAPPFRRRSTKPSRDNGDGSGSESGRLSLASSSCLPEFLSDMREAEAALGEDELSSANSRRLWYAEAYARGELARTFVAGFAALRLRLRETLLAALLRASDAGGGAREEVDAASSRKSSGRSLYDALRERRVSGAAPVTEPTPEPPTGVANDGSVDYGDVALALEVAQLATLEGHARQAINETFHAGLSELRVRHREAVAFGVQVFCSSISHCSGGGGVGGPRSGSDPLLSPLDGVAATPLEHCGAPSVLQGFAALHELNKQQLDALQGTRVMNADGCAREWDRWTDRKRRQGGSLSASSSRSSSPASSACDEEGASGAPLDMFCSAVRAAARRASEPKDAAASASSAQPTPGPSQLSSRSMSVDAETASGGSASARGGRKAERRKGGSASQQVPKPGDDLRPLDDDGSGNERLFAEIFGGEAGATRHPTAPKAAHPPRFQHHSAYDAENDLAATARRERGGRRDQGAAQAAPVPSQFSAYTTATFAGARGRDNTTSRKRSTTTPVTASTFNKAPMGGGGSGGPKKGQLCALGIDPKTFAPSLDGRLYCIQSHATAERGREEVERLEQAAEKNNAAHGQQETDRGTPQDFSSLWADVAGAYLEAGGYHDAVKAAHTALRYNNQHHPAHVAAATAHLALLQVRKAKAQCEGGRTVRPITADVLKQYRAVAETAEAVENAQARAARPRPTDLDRRLAAKYAEAALLRYPSSQKPLSLHLLRLESLVYTRPKDSMPVIQALAATLPPRSDLNLLMGQAVLYSCKDDISIENALAYFKKAVECDAAAAVPAAGHGRAPLSVAARAKDIFDKTQRLCRLRAEVKEATASNKWHQVKLLLAKAINVDGDNAAMVAALRLQRADACCHLNDFETGVRECTAVLQADPQHAAAYELRSKLHLKLHHVDAAHADLESAARLSGKTYDFSAFEQRGEPRPHGFGGMPGTSARRSSTQTGAAPRPAPTRPEHCPGCQPYLLLKLDVGTNDAKSITKAYRALALTTHPDRVAPEKRADAETAFKDVSSAYTTLSTPKLKAASDQSHTCGRGGGRSRARW